MSVARFIASQRTEHGVPHAVACRALEVSESWYYKWHDRPPTPRQQRREQLTETIRVIFEASGKTYGSPRIGLELRAGRCPTTPSRRSWPKIAGQQGKLNTDAA